MQGTFDMSYASSRLLAQPLSTQRKAYENFLARQKGARQLILDFSEEDQNPGTRDHHDLRHPSNELTRIARRSGNQSGADPPYTTLSPSRALPCAVRVSATVERYVRDDAKIAVLFSSDPRYPWSSECNSRKGQEVTIFDRDVVTAILEDKRTLAAAIAKNKLAVLAPGHPLVTGRWDLVKAAKRVVVHWIEAEKA